MGPSQASLLEDLVDEAREVPLQRPEDFSLAKLLALETETIALKYALAILELV